MAMGEMLGGGLLGFQQGQADRARQQQLGALSMLGNTFTDTCNTTAITIRDASPVYTRPMTIREELQAEVNEWLPDL